MGQAFISSILKEKYPKYLNTKDLIDLSGTNKRSVFRTLRSLRKRDEVEFELRSGKSNKASEWVHYYRIRRN